MPLPVSGAFHTSLMKPAQDALVKVRLLHDLAAGLVALLLELLGLGLFAVGGSLWC